MAETIAKNVAVFGDHEPNTLAQLHDVASRAERAALMADGHQGYVMPMRLAPLRNSAAPCGSNRKAPRKSAMP